MDLMLRTILRMYNGVFSHFRSIDELHIAATSGLSRERVHDLLKMLWRMHVIRYIPAVHSPMIHLNCERLPISDLYIAPETYRHRYAMAEERYKNMLHYTLQIEECRSQVIERYFGDSASKPCGVCDICLKRKQRERDNSSIEQRIIELLSNAPMSVKECIAAIGGEEQCIVDVVDKMVRDSKISLSSDSKLKIIE